VNGAVTLAGSLNVSLASGFTPGPSSGFQVLTFASRTGDFAGENGLLFPGGRLAPVYHAGDLTLTTNLAPTARNDPLPPREGTHPPVTLLANDSDPAGDLMSIVGVTQPGHGGAVSNGDGTVTYTPAADYNGPDSFTYTIQDTAGNAATATVNIFI